MSKREEILNNQEILNNIISTFHEVKDKINFITEQLESYKIILTKLLKINNSGYTNGNIYYDKSEIKRMIDYNDEEIIEALSKLNILHEIIQDHK